MIVEAFVENGRPLIVSGSGTELDEIKRIATDNITVLGYTEDVKMVELMQNAKAFVFAAHEDFGIVPVEAMACGTPVIAFGKGGVLDSVIDGKTGLFFKEQTVESLNNAVRKFEEMTFDYGAIARHAATFDTKHFEVRVRRFIDEKMPEKR